MPRWRLGLNIPRQRRIHPDILVKKWKYVKGDLVSVISGREKGKQGVITRADHKHNRVFIKGVFMQKKEFLHQNIMKQQLF